MCLLLAAAQLAAAQLAAEEKTSFSLLPPFPVLTIDRI
jgi:hypothetical protein